MQMFVGLCRTVESCAGYCEALSGTIDALLLWLLSFPHLHKPLNPINPIYINPKPPNSSREHSSFPGGGLAFADGCRVVQGCRESSGVVKSIVKLMLAQSTRCCYDCCTSPLPPNSSHEHGSFPGVVWVRRYLCRAVNSDCSHMSFFTCNHMSISSPAWCMSPIGSILAFHTAALI